jgi:hypothetical protein
MTTALVLGLGTILAAEPQQASSLRAKVTPDVLKKWSPEVQFHRLERFFPASMEELVQGARRYKQGDPQDKWIPIKSADDLKGLGDDWRIAFDRNNPKVLNGDISSNRSTVTAPMYVAVRVPADGSFVELNYRFLFGFNGPQSMRCHNASSFNFSMPSLAEHEGDWEGINITLSPDLNEVVMVTTEAHGDTVNWLPDQMDWSAQTHVRVSSAVNSHGMYNGKGKNKGDDWFELEDLKVLSLIDIISTAGPVWKPWTLPSGSIRTIGGGSKEAWATYAGRMGSFKRNDIGSPCDFNGGSLSTGQKFAANALSSVMKLAKNVKLLKEGFFDGAPCSGPGARPTMNLELGAPPSMEKQKQFVIYSRVPGNMVLTLNNGEPVLTPFQQGEAAQCWYVLDLPEGRVQIINAKTGQSLRTKGGKGKNLTTVTAMAKTGQTTWTIARSRNNCAIRPVQTDSQNLNVLTNGPYRAGAPVGTWDWSGGKPNEAWNIVEAK